MTYKLIAMDFDGTLLTDDKKVSEKTMNMLKKLKEEGYIIVGATARPLEGAKDAVDISMFNYLILNNGAYIYDVDNSQGKYINSISKDLAQQITKIVENNCTQIDYCSGNMYYIYKNKRGNPVPFIKDIDNINEMTEDVARMNLFLLDQTKAEAYKDMLEKEYPTINPFIMQDSTSTTRWLVINPEGLNKKTSLELLGTSLNISLEDMLFFGDGTNDIEVMQAVGCSIAMGNALEEVKAVANKITKTNNEDGIATFLEVEYTTKNNNKNKKILSINQ